MPPADLMKNIIANYERHGWKLRRALLSPETTATLATVGYDFAEVELRESDFEALWFARPSSDQREAWELRLISEQAYALFEAFEIEEAEQDREAARHEMENRMREHVGRQRSQA